MAAVVSTPSKGVLALHMQERISAKKISPSSLRAVGKNMHFHVFFQTAITSPSIRNAEALEALLVYSLHY
jgi:hypothetical protein